MAAPRRFVRSERTQPELAFQVDLPPSQLEVFEVHPKRLDALRNLGQAVPRVVEEALSFVPLPASFLHERRAFCLQFDQILGERADMGVGVRRAKVVCMLWGFQPLGEAGGATEFYWMRLRVNEELQTRSG